MAASFQFGRGDVEDFEPFRPLAEAGWHLSPSLGTLFAITILAGIASQAGLGAFQFNAGLWAPKASRVNPLSGLKRILGPQGWIELRSEEYTSELQSLMRISYAVFGLK